MTEINRLSLNEISHRQIGQHAGIPAKYYDKMKADYPELLTANVNGWFEREPQEEWLGHLTVQRERIYLTGIVE